MKGILYYISLSLLFVLNRMPFFVLYLLSDVIYFLVYYLVRYRRKIVRDNLVKSFPEKSLKEIKSIERKFYSVLCDYFVETVKLYGLSKNQISKRMVFTGVEDVDRMLAEGRSCVCYMGHFIN